MLLLSRLFIKKKEKKVEPEIYHHSINKKDQSRKATFIIRDNLDLFV